MDLEITRAKEIITLHGEILGHLKTSLEKAIRIGELLSEQKAALMHGEFGKWIEANLPFTDRTARNYMHVYRERDRLKTENVSVLSDAYRMPNGEPGRTGLDLMLQAPGCSARMRAQAAKREKQNQVCDEAHKRANESGVGAVRYGTFGPGWEYKLSIEGFINGYPLVHCEVTDPVYKKLKEQEAPFDLQCDLENIADAMETVHKTIVKVIKKHGAEALTKAYRLNGEGFYPFHWRILRELKSLRKAIDRIPTECASFPEYEKSLAGWENQEMHSLAYRDGWTSWGNEATF